MTIYEVISNYEFKVECVLNIGVAVAIVFTKDEMCRGYYTAETIIGNVSIHDQLKFEFSKETADWIHFKDCNNLGYILSIRK